eukprot:11751-Heterococcus_DN1.PRE.2
MVWFACSTRTEGRAKQGSPKSQRPSKTQPGIILTRFRRAHRRRFFRAAPGTTHTLPHAKMLPSCALLFLALAARVAAAALGEYSAVWEGGSAATHTLSFSPDAATGEYAESSMKFMVSTTASSFACHKHIALELKTLHLQLRVP